METNYLLKKTFAEYCITYNCNAFSPYNAEEMDELKKSVKKDAQRYIKFLGIYVEGLNADILTDYFFATVMQKGIDNVAKRGF